MKTPLSSESDALHDPVQIIAGPESYSLPTELKH